MKIDEILVECWPKLSQIHYTRGDIESLLNGFQKCLKERLAGLSPEDQIVLMSSYLHMLGFSESQPLREEKAIIKLSYTIPGQIRFMGLAKLMGGSQFAVQQGGSEQTSDFLFMFDFDSENNTISTPNSKTIVVHLEDCVRMFSYVLAIRLYRDLEPYFRRNASETSWFLEYLETDWGLATTEIAVLEGRWNSLADSKIQLRDYG